MQVLSIYTSLTFLSSRWDCPTTSVRRCDTHLTTLFYRRQRWKLLPAWVQMWLFWILFS